MAATLETIRYAIAYIFRGLVKERQIILAFPKGFMYI